MTKDIEDTCKACELCLAGKMRREKLQSLFDMNAPLARAAPRQHYGIDFYGLMSGEILIMVNLFTRETLLQWLPSREQTKVAQTILRRIVLERGVPISLIRQRTGAHKKELSRKSAHISIYSKL
jgi:hypothetical protein